MDDINPLEKAKIFYNHLICKHVPSEYYEAIITNKNYLKIVQHSNYTPRIIEHVTYQTNYLKVAPEGYANYILDSMSRPYDIWKNEFDRRLKDVDRAFVSTLYSLTDTTVKNSVIEKCFNKRLLRMKNVDCTINNYESVLTRLNQSIIKLIDKNGTKLLSAINPSVNDYMKTVFSENELELDEVRKSIIHFSQFERCYAKEDLINLFCQLVKNEKILDIEFSTQEERTYFIVSNICLHEIQQHQYKLTVNEYVNNAYGYSSQICSGCLPHIDILEKLLNSSLGSYYSLFLLFNDKDCVDRLLADLDLDELVDTINLLSQYYRKNDVEALWFETSCKYAITDSISSLVKYADISDYCDSHDINLLVYANTETYNYIEIIEEKLKEGVVEGIANEVAEILSKLGDTISIQIDELIERNIDFDGIESIINNYLKSEFDYDEPEFHGSQMTYGAEIEAIFER